MDLVISTKVQKKIWEKDDRKITISDIEQCFLNRSKGFLVDDREDNRTDPPTKWFISTNDAERVLKIVFIEKGNGYEIKTAYPPNKKEVRIYEELG